MIYESEYPTFQCQEVMTAEIPSKVGWAEDPVNEKLSGGEACKGCEAPEN